MVTPDKPIMEGNWLPIYPHSQLVIRYAGNRKLPVARGNKKGRQVIYRWKPLSHNMNRCTSYLTHHPWSQYFRINGMNSIAIIITMEVHYTACEGMDCFFKFNVFLISWIHHFLLPFLPQKAASRINTNLYQLYVYWKYSYKISTWHAFKLFEENLRIRTIRTGSFVVSNKIKTNAKMTNQDLQQV